MPRCSVVIPNFNGEDLLAAHLPSVIAAAAKYSQQTEVIVVDDASTDASVLLVEDEFPSVQLIVRNENGGFSEAVHNGVAASNGELILLLNSDVQVPENILEQLVPRLTETSVFAVSPLIVNEAGTLSDNTWVKPYFQRGRLKSQPVQAQALRSAAQQQQSLPTLYCSGGSMLFRKTQFDALGGFDELFQPYYSEDLDLGLRAWLRGWQSLVDPSVEVLHKDKGSIETHHKSDRIKRVQRRNRYFVEWIHYPASRLALTTLPFSALQYFGELLSFDKKNIGGFHDAIRQLGAVRQRRRELATHRVRSLDDVVDALAQ